jgi:anthranilate phosphoribosyltransferase
VRDIVLLNAAAALLAYDGPDVDAPLVDQLAPRLDRAAAAIDLGKAREQLARWIEVTAG